MVYLFWRFKLPWINPQLPSFPISELLDHATWKQHLDVTCEVQQQLITTRETPRRLYLKLLESLDGFVGLLVCGLRFSKALVFKLCFGLLFYTCPECPDPKTSNNVPVLLPRASNGTSDPAKPWDLKRWFMDAMLMWWSQALALMAKQMCFPKTLTLRWKKTQKHSQRGKTNRYESVSHVF